MDAISFLKLFETTRMQTFGIGPNLIVGVAQNWSQLLGKFSPQLRRVRAPFRLPISGGFFLRPRRYPSKFCACRMTSPPSFVIHFSILLRISELDLNLVRQMYVSHLGSLYTPYRLRGRGQPTSVNQPVDAAATLKP